MLQDPCGTVLYEAPTVAQHTARQRQLFFHPSRRAEPGTWYYPNAGVFLSSLTGARALLSQLRGLVAPNSSPDPIPIPDTKPAPKPKPDLSLSLSLSLSLL